MAINTISNHFVYPTENDVHGGNPGDGLIHLEKNMVELFRGGMAGGGMLGRKGFVVSGFVVPSSGTLVESVTGGTAVIDGHLITPRTLPANNGLAFQASTTTNVYLRLMYDTNGKVTSAQLETIEGASEPTPPANSIKLGKVVTGASTITGATDQRPKRFCTYGRIKRTAGVWAIDEAGSADWTFNGTNTITYSPFERPPLFLQSGVGGGSILTPPTTTAVVLTLGTSNGDFVDFMALL